MLKYRLPWFSHMFRLKYLRNVLCIPCFHSHPRVQQLTSDVPCCALPANCPEAGATQVRAPAFSDATYPRFPSTIYTQFTLKSPIKVMRADLLEKEQGVSELYRNTYVKAIMRGDGSFLVLWAGAIE